MPLMVPLRVAVALLAAFPVLAGATSPSWTTRGSWTYHENHGRASGPVDFRDVHLFSGSLAAGWSRQVAPSVTARASVEGGLLLPDRHDRLQEATLAFRGGLERKFGLGPAAPVAGIDLAGTFKAARLGEQQGLLVQARGHVSRRWADWLSTSLAGELDERQGRNAVFDQSQQRLRASLSLDPTASLRFTVGASRQWGTYHAAASSGRFAGALAGGLGQAVADYYRGIPQFTTELYGPGWVLYRVRGEVDTTFAECSPALGDHTSLAFRVERIRADNLAGVRYRQTAWTIAVVHAF